ncbi:MAG TPA: AAA family ATPase [Candidatus Thermoplasmatota archaeon]
MDIGLLYPWNSHWDQSEVSPLVLAHPRPRASVHYWVEDILDPPADQWHVVAGPRQIGKTTGLGHVVRGLLDRGIAPRSIAFVPLDQPMVQEAIRNDLDELIRSLQTQHPPIKSAPLYLLLDEVQELDAWAKRLKAAWDQYRFTTRVLATGSSALRLIRPADADFPGRIRVTTMHAMKFREVLMEHPDRLQHATRSEWDELERLARATRSLITDPSRDEEFKAALLAIRGLVNATQPPLDPFIRSTFLNYAVFGGYPRARPGNAIAASERRAVFDQALNAVLAKDLPSIGVSKPREFTWLFSRLARNPGGKFVAHKVARQIEVKPTTVAHYKRILEDAILISQLPALNPSLRPTNAKDKAYTNDPGWYAYFRGITDTTQVSDAELGFLVETVLVDHMRRLQFNLTKTTTLPIGYVDAPEVDVALSIGTRWILLEAKYRTNPKRAVSRIPSDDNALHMIATRSHFEIPRQAGEPYYVPAHLWALLA